MENLCEWDIVTIENRSLTIQVDDWTSIDATIGSPIFTTYSLKSNH